MPSESYAELMRAESNAELMRADSDAELMRAESDAELTRAGSDAEAVARPRLPRVGPVAALRVDRWVQVRARDRQQLRVGRHLWEEISISSSSIMPVS